MGDDVKKPWQLWTAIVTFFGAVVTAATGALNKCSSSLTGDAPQEAKQEASAPTPTTWEEKYQAAVAALKRQSDEYFTKITGMQVDLAGARDRVEKLRAQVADTETAIAKLDEAIMASSEGGEVKALGRTYTSAEAAQNTLASWLADYKTKKMSLLSAMENQERLATSVDNLKRYRSEIQQRIIGAQSNFEAKRAQLSASQAEREIAAMQTAATRLATPGAAQDLASVFGDLDKEILTEQQRANLVREDAAQARGDGTAEEATRAVRQERERLDADDLLLRLREKRAPKPESR